MAHLHALPRGHVFEGYRIERVLGAGGFGITYLAAETMIGREVAIKEFLPSSIAGRAIDSASVHPLVAADAEMFRWGLKRFRNEARTLVSFHHPHIVQVYRYFEANGTEYLVRRATSCRASSRGSPSTGPASGSRRTAPASRAICAGAAGGAAARCGSRAASSTRANSSTACAMGSA